MTAPTDNLLEACKAWAKRFALRDDGEALVAFVQAQRDDAAREALERAAMLMAGPQPQESFDAFQADENRFCRLVEHVQGMCECEERAQAIRALLPPAKEAKP